MMQNPIQIQDLIDYAAGDLDARRIGRIESMLATSAAARATVNLFRSLGRDGLGDALIGAPRSSVDRVRALARTKPATEDRRESMLDRLDRIIATLLFDSRVQLAGVRSSGVLERFSACYEAGELQIDLDAEPRQHDGDIQWAVIGQLSGDDRGNAIIDITDADDRRVAALTTDADGLFQTALKPGTYEIRVATSAREIVVPELVLV